MPNIFLSSHELIDHDLSLRFCEYRYIMFLLTIFFFISYQVLATRFVTPAELLESLKLLLLGCTSPLFEPDLRPSEADPHHISVHSACVDVDIASHGESSDEGIDA